MSAEILKRHVRHSFTSTYTRLRKLGWPACGAYRAAKTHAQWFMMHDGDNSETLGNVRVVTMPDECFEMDDLKGDMFVPRANPGISKPRLRREELAFEERVQREGICILLGEYWDGHEWVYVDSCGGFIGDDAVDSGYDTDIMQKTMDDASAFLASRFLVGAV